MAACFVFTMAGSNAGVVVDVGLNQASAGANFERGAANTADIFWRQEDAQRCGRGDHSYGDNGGNGGNGGGGDHGKHCCNGDHRDSDNGDHDHDHDHCEKSPSKPPY